MRQNNSLQNINTTLIKNYYNFFPYIKILIDSTLIFLNYYYNEESLNKILNYLLLYDIFDLIINLLNNKSNFNTRLLKIFIIMFLINFIINTVLMIIILIYLIKDNFTKHIYIYFLIRLSFYIFYIIFLMIFMIRVLYIYRNYRIHLNPDNSFQNRINKLKNYSFQNDNIIENNKIIKKLEDRNCTICSEDYLNYDKVIILLCNHHFHADCIVKWLILKNNCPICRNINV